MISSFLSSNNSLRPVTALKSTAIDNVLAQQDTRNKNQESNRGLLSDAVRSRSPVRDTFVRPANKTRHFSDRLKSAMVGWDPNKAIYIVPHGALMDSLSISIENRGYRWSEATRRRWWRTGGNRMISRILTRRKRPVRMH